MLNTPTILSSAIAAFVKQGEEVSVVDNDSGEDLTAVTFAQIILEEERKK